MLVIRELRQYTQSPQAAADTPKVREVRLRNGYDRIMQLAGFDLPDDVVRALGDDLVTRVLDGIAEYVGETAQADTSGGCSRRRKARYRRGMRYRACDDCTRWGRTDYGLDQAVGYDPVTVMISALVAPSASP